MGQLIKNFLSLIEKRTIAKQYTFSKYEYNEGGAFWNVTLNIFT